MWETRSISHGDVIISRQLLGIASRIGLQVAMLLFVAEEDVMGSEANMNPLSI